MMQRDAERFPKRLVEFTGSFQIFYFTIKTKAAGAIVTSAVAVPP